MSLGSKTGKVIKPEDVLDMFHEIVTYRFLNENKTMTYEDMEQKYWDTHFIHATSRGFYRYLPVIPPKMTVGMPYNGLVLVRTNPDNSHFHALADVIRSVDIMSAVERSKENIRALSEAGGAVSARATMVCFDEVLSILSCACNATFTGYVNPNERGETIVTGRNGKGVQITEKILNVGYSDINMTQRLVNQLIGKPMTEKSMVAFFDDLYKELVRLSARRAEYKMVYSINVNEINFDNAMNWNTARVDTRKPIPDRYTTTAIVNNWLRG